MTTEFANTYKQDPSEPITHVGIYVGGGQMIHAPHTGTVVQISSLSDAWYSAECQGAVRVTG